MKKFYFITMVVPIVLSACGQTPEQKMVNEAERVMETSGYNDCMESLKEKDVQFEACKKTEVIAHGYTDGRSCVGEGDHTGICADNDRYNAEVDAIKVCGSKYYGPTAITMFDCAKLMNQ